MHTARYPAQESDMKPPRSPLHPARRIVQQEKLLFHSRARLVVTGRNCKHIFRLTTASGQAMKSWVDGSLGWHGQIRDINQPGWPQGPLANMAVSRAGPRATHWITPEKALIEQVHRLNCTPSACAGTAHRAAPIATASRYGMNFPSPDTSGRSRLRAGFSLSQNRGK
jgi:hypothetical protein